MEYPRQITTLQAAAVLISTIIGVGVLSLPLFAVRSADSGAPLVTLIGILIAFAGLLILAKLELRFKRQFLIVYSERIIGKWPARVFGVLIIGFFALLTSLAAREFGEVVITSVLKRTPLEVTVMVMLVLAAISTRNDISTFAYIHHFYLPVLVGPALLIIALSLKNADVVNLLPIWGNQPRGMLTGAVTVAGLFQGSFILTMVTPAMRHPDKIVKSITWAIIIAGGIYLLFVIAVVAVFGNEEVKNLLWPTLELAKATSLPANILERLDAAFLAVWVTAVFTTLFATYYLTSHALSRLFGLKDHRLFSSALLPFVFVMAMLPQNIMQMYQIIQVVLRYGLLLTIGYPLLLLIVAAIRKKKGNDDDKPMEPSG